MQRAPAAARLQMRSWRWQGPCSSVCPSCARLSLSSAEWAQLLGRRVLALLLLLLLLQRAHQVSCCLALHSASRACVHPAASAACPTPATLPGPSSLVLSRDCMAVSCRPNQLRLACSSR